MSCTTVTEFDDEVCLEARRDDGLSKKVWVKLGCLRFHDVCAVAHSRADSSLPPASEVGLEMHSAAVRLRAAEEELRVFRGRA